LCFGISSELVHTTQTNRGKCNGGEGEGGREGHWQHTQPLQWGRNHAVKTRGPTKKKIKFLFGFSYHTESIFIRYLKLNGIFIWLLLSRVTLNRVGWIRVFLSPLFVDEQVSLRNLSLVLLLLFLQIKKEISHREIKETFPLERSWEEMNCLLCSVMVIFFRPLYENYLIS